MTEPTKEDKLKGTRYDDTLTVEGEGADTVQQGRHGDEVLVERSKTHGTNPCQKFGHRPNAEGNVCRFCGSPL